MAPREFPEALPHGPVVEVFPDVFVVRGTFRFMPLFAITRNMTVVRSDGELTLINSVRLSPEGEAALDRLGVVKRVVRLGSFHGADDPYCLQRWPGAELWAPAGTRPRGAERVTRTLAEGEPGPVADAQVFLFRRAKLPEAALLLAREGGILVSCDSVQNWTDFDGCSWVGKRMMRAFGFGGAGQIGPGWRRLAEAKPQEGPNFAEDFERLVKLEFRHLLSAHGDPLLHTARDDVRTQVQRTYGA